MLIILIFHFFLHQILVLLDVLLLLFDLYHKSLNWLIDYFPFNKVYVNLYILYLIINLFKLYPIIIPNDKYIKSYYIINLYITYLNYLINLLKYFIIFIDYLLILFLDLHHLKLSLHFYNFISFFVIFNIK